MIVNKGFFLILYIFIFFRLKKENKGCKDRIIWDIRNFFEHKEEYYYKPVTVNNFRSNNYIKCKSKGDIKTL